MENITKDMIDEWILAYLEGSIDEQQTAELKEWVLSSDENRTYFKQMVDVWFTSEAMENTSNYNVDKAYHQFLEKIGAGKAQKHFSKRLFWHYAAIAVSIIIPTFIAFFIGDERVKSSFTQIIVEAPMGSRTKTILPDGSSVWLNAGSQIIYSQGFGVTDRDLKMSGEGYFEVVRNDKLPFVVTSNDIRLSVHGTKFNFRDYPKDQEITVALFEGKLQLDNLMKNQEALFLTPSDFMVLNKADSVMMVYGDRANKENSEKWGKGYMIFDEMLLSDILNVLELNYDVTVILKNDELKNDRYRGLFIRNEQSIQQVLEALKSASNGILHYNIENNEIIIY